jgi:AcrR family transcriptional regulator
MARGGVAQRSAPLSARYRGARPRADRADEFAQAQVSEIQRARILSAMFDLAGEHGAARVSVAHVVERSGVSRRTFYEAFTDREDCFLAAFEKALELTSRRVLPAYRGERKWRERIRAGLLALLLFLEEEPAVGRLLIVESLSGGPRTLEHRERALGLIVDAIEEGRVLKGAPRDGERPGGHERAGIQSAVGASLPPLTGEGLVGGVLAVIGVRLTRTDQEPLVGLVNQLTSMIVLPYQGAAAARRELERPVPASSVSTECAPRLVDPFKGMRMRLTYRTVRVLLAVAEHPGSSNRQLGDSAGISDQGQISKLLGRLQRLELISNTGLAPGLGAPNAWSLTSKGKQFTDSIHAHTQHTDNIPRYQEKNRSEKEA